MAKFDVIDICINLTLRPGIIPRSLNWPFFNFPLKANGLLINDVTQINYCSEPQFPPFHINMGVLPTAL